MNKVIPAKLYKFQSYNAYSIENLKRCAIWFSNPEKFNDPFDCSISYAMDSISKRNWKIIGKYLSDYRERDDDEARRVRTSIFFQGNAINPNARGVFSKIIVDNIKKGLQKDFENAGIACLSEKVDNILMWSHYGNGHRGFCLEFDTAFSPFSGAERVTYTKKLPPLRLKDDPNQDLTRSIFLTKSKGWSYEKEWRVIREGGNIEVSYPSEALTAIYLGCVMPQRHKDVITSIFSGKLTKVYEMKRHEKEFRVVV